VLARLQTGVDPAAFAKQYGSAVLDKIASTGTISLKLPVGYTEISFVAKLTADPRVIWAEIDTYLFSGIQARPGVQYHYAFDYGKDSSTYVNQFAARQVRLGASHNYTKGSGAVVAVLDTGVTFSHPALQGHLLPGYNVLAPSTLPNEVANGKTNAAMGHGTMVAGIIALIAPEAPIMPIKVLDADGLGSLLNIAKGVDYAVNHGAKVLNLSFGGSTPMSALNDALDRAERAGILIVAAAGNNGREEKHFPASGGKGALAVAAVEANNTKSTYSNYGSWVRVVAPGSGIRSTYYDGGYASWSGTSFAAPIVSAQAALLFSLKPTMTADLVKESIRGTARSVDEVNPLYRGRLGKGIIDIEASLKDAR
jgi:subtilisin family serine protease